MRGWDDEPVFGGRGYWFRDVFLPGATQMQHLKSLLLSRPCLSRIPDQSCVVPTNTSRQAQSNHAAATRDGTPGQQDATYIMLYRPTPYRIGVDTSAIAGKKLRLWPYDPVSGYAQDLGERDNEGHILLRSKIGPDSVIVVDDASCDYPRPGTQALGRYPETRCIQSVALRKASLDAGAVRAAPLAF